MLGCLSQQSTAQTNAPGAPTFLEVTAGSADTSGRVKVRAPVLPPGATQLILQSRTSAQTDASFATVTDADTQQVANNLGSNAITVVGGLRLSTRYVFRYSVETSPGVFTRGEEKDVVIPGAAAGTPGAPRFSNLTATGVTITAPVMPTGTLSLTLQVRPQNTTTYSTIATELAGNSITEVIYPTTQRNHYFRFVAVGTQGEIIGEAVPTTSIPEAPVVVVNSTTAQSVSFQKPVTTGTTWDELVESMCVLQRKKNGEPDSAYREWGRSRSYGGGYVVASQLAPATSYIFRWCISGENPNDPNSAKGGIAYGPGTNVSTLSGTQPAEVGPPTFSNIGPVSVTVIAPATSLSTLRASRLKLQRFEFLYGYWVDVTDNLTPGAQTTVTGLSSLTIHSFRYLAIASGPPELTTAGVSATVTTASAAPETPGVPSFVSATTTSITVNLPLITAPLRTASLTLQYKLAEDPGDFSDWGTGHLAGGTVVVVTGLAPGRAYQMRTRAHAVVAGQGDTFGALLGTGTPAPAPGAPNAPQIITILDPYTVQIKAPATMPSNADYLKLQVLPVSLGTSTWIDITDSDGLPLTLLSNEITEISGLTPGLTYRFRYAAVGTGGVSFGPAYGDILMPVTSASWASSASGTLARTIQCKGIRYPNPANGAVTVARGAGLRLSSYLATDWDQRTISAAGTPYTVSYYLSDPCVYFWNAKDTGGNSVGSFQDGVNRTQNAVWIAPSTPGTYNLTLIVSDQENGNKATTDANSRDDDNRGTWDAPLTFQLTVTVP